MKDYYRKLITDLLPKITDEMKLHEIYVLALMGVRESESNNTKAELEVHF